MAPHTTNVPAEKKLIKSESPLIHQGTAPSPAKNDFILFPDPEKANPQITTIREKIAIVIRSKFAIAVYSLCQTYLFISVTIKLFIKKIPENVTENVFIFRKRFRITRFVNGQL